VRTIQGSSAPREKYAVVLVTKPKANSKLATMTQATTGPVPADDPQNLPLGNRQRHLFQSPNGAVAGGGGRPRPESSFLPEPSKGGPENLGKAFPQGAVGAVITPQAVLFAQLFNGDGNGICAMHVF